MMDSSRGTTPNIADGLLQIFKGVVGVVNILRLRNEEKLRWTREHRSRQRYMARQATAKTRIQARQTSKLKRKDTRVNRHDENSNSSRTSSVSSERSKEDDDPRYMMTGAITRTADPHSRSKSNTEREPPRSSHSGPQVSLSQSDTESEQQSHGHSHRKHRQRCNSKGEPLIRGRHGWRKPPIGPPPTYKFERNATLGYAAHVKKCMEWGKKEYEHQQRKKERRKRGTLKERKLARIGRKEKDVDRRKWERRESREGTGRATYRGSKNKSDRYETGGQYRPRTHKYRSHRDQSSSISSTSISSSSISNSTHRDAESPHTHSRTNTPSPHQHEEEAPKHGAGIH